MLPHYSNPAEVIVDLTPDEPVWCFNAGEVTKQARHMVGAFDGEVLYAVKCNHDEHFLRAVHAGGVRHFDTASLGEVALIKSMFPETMAYFMHPVKSPEAIATAANRFGVRHFVVDHPVELEKVLVNTEGLDPVIVVRIAVARGAAVYDLGGKFGCEVPQAAELLKMARARGKRVGISFHVGSQCLTPAPYIAALARVGELLKMAPGMLDLLDVGGGFPARYEGAELPPFEDFARAISDSIAGLSLNRNCQIFCEPGRSIVAGGVSLVTRIELRRDSMLYLNDGVFGSLAELRFPGIHLPMTVVRPDGSVRKAQPDHKTPFSIFGPTCDTVDALPGPYFLPSTTEAGDYLVFGMAGAYTMATRTRFNGFYAGKMVAVESLSCADGNGASGRGAGGQSAKIAA